MEPNDVFDKAVQFVLQHEGERYTNIAGDSGGSTKLGISERFLKNLKNEPLSSIPIADLTREDAVFLYKKYFWDNGHFELIAEKQPILTTKVFDEAVNIGTEKAVKLLQQSFVMLYPLRAMISDGVLGPKTAVLINLLKSDNIYDTYVDSISNYYRVIANKNSALSKFLAGWLRRAADRPVIEGVA